MTKYYLDYVEEKLKKVNNLLELSAIKFDSANEDIDQAFSIMQEVIESSGYEVIGSVNDKDGGFFEVEYESKVIHVRAKPDKIKLFLSAVNEVKK